jgi:hypothetical protein
MAGILANSASETMVAGDTAVDKTVSSYVRNERVALSVTPSGTTYRWTMVIPNGSSAGKTSLSDSTDAAPTFVPDIGGVYVITCVVDETTYVLRMTVVNTAQSEQTEAIRLTPRADAQITAPSAGAVLYYSTDEDALVTKDSAGTVDLVGTDPTFAQVNAALLTADAGIDVNGQLIRNVGDGDLDTDVATRGHANTKLALAGGTMSGPVAMGGNVITSLGTGTSRGDAANCGYVDDKTALSNAIATLLYGDASDEDAEISTTISVAEDKYYGALTFTAGGKLVLTNGCKLYCHEVDFTNADAGAITAVGASGGNASGATAGAAATGHAALTVGGSGTGTAGAAGATGNGAGAGVNTALALGSGATGGNSGTGGKGAGTTGASGSTATMTGLWFGQQIFDHSIRGATLVGGGSGARGGGSGGGDGASAKGGAGGGGGAGGPYCAVYARKIITGSSTPAGVVRALGGNGGNGGDGEATGGATGGGAGGGGGGGGRVDVRYLLHQGPTLVGAFWADGGTGGAGGSGVNGNGTTTGTNGTAGGGGDGGYVSVTDLKTGITTYKGATLAAGGATAGQTREDLLADAGSSAYKIMAPEFDAIATREVPREFALAASDVRATLDTVTGEVWSITTEVDTSNTSAIIALTTSSAYFASLPQAVRTLAEDLTTPESFALYQTDGTALYVVSSTLTGCRHGLYEVCDRLGVRWYLPGDAWTVYPTGTVSHRITADEVVEPVFRRMWSWDTWPSNLSSYPLESPTVPQTDQEKWDRRNRYTTEYHTAGHAWQTFIARTAAAPGTPLVSDPIFWAERDGERVVPDNPAATNCKFHSTHYGTVSGTEDPDDYSTFGGTYRLFILDRLSALQSLVNADPDQMYSTGVTVMPSDGYSGIKGFCRCSKCVNLLRNGPWVQVDVDSTDSDCVFTLAAGVANRMNGTVDMARRTEYAQAATVLASGLTTPDPDDLNGRYALCAAMHTYASAPNDVVILPDNVVITLAAWDAGTRSVAKQTDTELIAGWVSHRTNTSANYILADKNFTLQNGTGDLCEPTYSAHLSHYRRQYLIDAGFEGCVLTAPNSTFSSGWFSWLMARQGWDDSTSSVTLLDEAFDALFGAASDVVRELFEGFWETHNRWETSDWQLTSHNIGRAYQLLGQARALVVGETEIEARLKQLRWYVHFLRLAMDYDEQIFTARDSQEHLDAANALVRWAWCCHPYGIVDAYGTWYYRRTIESATINAAISANWSTSKSVSQSPWNGCTASAAESLAAVLEDDEAEYIATVITDVAITATTLSCPVAANAGTDYVTAQYATSSSPAATWFLAPGGEAVSVKVGVDTTTLDETSTARVVIRDDAGDVVSTHDAPYGESPVVGTWYDTTIDLGSLSAGQYSTEVLTMSASEYYRIAFQRKIPNGVWGRQRHNIASAAQYFWVPTGTATVIVEGTWFGGTPPVIKCDGVTVTPTSRFNELVCTVGSGQDGKVWSVTGARWGGSLSSRLAAFLRLRGVPNILSPSADQVLTLS